VDDEIQYLKKMFTNIRYRNKDIIKTINRDKDENKERPPSTKSQPLSKTYLPNIEGDNDNRRQMLARFSV